jgi:hypothetical protein
VGAGLFALPYVFAVSAQVVDYFEPWDNEKHMESAVSFFGLRRIIFLV